MTKKVLAKDLQRVVEDLGFKGVDIVLSIPKNSAYGDYTTNIALQLANQKLENGKQSPSEIAKQIIEKLNSLDYLEKIEFAGTGFINIFLKDSSLMENVPKVCDYSCFINPEVEIENDDRKKILVEYASFNALKPVHIGHLRNITLGESVSRLFEADGNRIFRVTYTSDIGLPAAKVVWGLNKLNDEFKQVSKGSLEEKVKLLGKAYVEGSKFYEEDESVKTEIDDINKRIYAGDEKVVPIWKEALEWTFEYFDIVYQKVGSKFDTQILESEAVINGKKIVEDNIGKVFFEDQGAIIFRGEEHGLHNRVFISTAGNPTYEAKDMGLAELEYKAFPFDLAIHVVGKEQEEYFKVIFKALEQIEPELAKKEQHLSYGFVSLPDGKMSSRTGNVVTIEWLTDQVRDKVAEIMKDHKELTGWEKQNVIDIVSIGAIKFSMLKYSPQTDITFDIEKSVSLEGDSGPYVQYTYARAKSVLRSAQYDYQPGAEARDLEPEERELLRKIEHFQSVVEEASSNLSPNTVATFLIELARSFNLFYQKHPIIKHDRSELRLALTCATAVILKQGLNLLGIEAPERM
jgi:arginyl-tRNA synthetase